VPRATGRHGTSRRGPPSGTTAGRKATRRCGIKGLRDFEDRRNDARVTLLPEGMTRSRWLYARLLTCGEPVRFIYYPPGEPAGHRDLYMYDDETINIGRLIWQVCDYCRSGHINSISINTEFQRRGLGRRLILRALRDGPRYRWATSGQSPDAKRFFPCITAEVGVEFTERGGTCRHLKAGMSGPPTHAARPRRPVVDRTV